jgi:hypothetical protein
MVIWTLTKSTSWKCMKRNTNVKKHTLLEFPYGIFLIRNTHPWGLHALYLIRGFLTWKLMQFINSPLESIICSMASGLVAKISWYQIIFLVGSHIGFRGVFGSVFMHHNSNGWFLVGHAIFSLIFSVISSNSFCSSLWKVIASFGSFSGYSNHFVLFTWSISTLSCKTFSILFFIFIVNIVGILQMTTKKL